MFNHIDAPVKVDYTTPRIRDWRNLRHIIKDNFPEIKESSQSYLIRHGMNKMIVARSEQKILGFCYFEEFSRSKLHLLYLATDKNFNRQGIASQLLKHLNCFATNRGYISIVLTVEKNNLAAKNLYEKIGYVLNSD